MPTSDKAGTRPKGSGAFRSCPDLCGALASREISAVDRDGHDADSGSASGRAAGRLGGGLGSSGPYRAAASPLAEQVDQHEGDISSPGRDRLERVAIQQCGLAVATEMIAMSRPSTSAEFQPSPTQAGIAPLGHGRCPVAGHGNQAVHPAADHPRCRPATLCRT
jgi:hypothetical protein